MTACPQPIPTPGHIFVEGSYSTFRCPLHGEEKKQDEKWKKSRGNKKTVRLPTPARGLDFRPPALAVTISRCHEVSRLTRCELVEVLALQFLRACWVVRT